jgi:hypothetical protein
MVPFVFGCEAEGEDVTVENRSSEVVVVFEDDVPGSLVHPAVTERFHILRFSGTLTYSVETFETREVLAERSFTWEEISDEGGITIVIE